ncbi:MAG: MOSC domain-containing protein [Methylocystaceae bacterium]
MAEVKEDWGIIGDGHGGDWGRQITLLKSEAVTDLARDYNLDIKPGEMAENILTRDLDLNLIPLGARLKLGEGVILQVTQVGKEDHPSVVIRRFGRSLLPRQGLFTRVEKGGTIRPDDAIEWLV